MDFVHVNCNRNETRQLILQAKKNPTTRYCRECKALLPLERFSQANRRFFCREHYRLLKTWHKYGTPEKRAIEKFRNKALLDKNVFGHPNIAITKKDIKDITTPEQMEKYPLWAIVPVHPDQPLAPKNAIVVSTPHRKHLTAAWKQNHDVDEYRRILDLARGQQTGIAGVQG
jgi:hypothetical protein